MNITIEEIWKRAESDAKTYGYHLNPDPVFLQSLLEGLQENQQRYGYLSCPCRLASGNFEFDRDILCPCDYRDPDVLEYGSCYCALYVRKDVHENKTVLNPIPERRPEEKQQRTYGRKIMKTDNISEKQEQIRSPEEPPVKKKLWYCKQCGYVVFRQDPPYICPICKAKRTSFADLSIRITD